MNVCKLLASGAVSALLITASRGSAAVFTYSYQTVFDANAGTYIVGQQNVKKYSEWQAPPITYWGPAANDADARLTLKFDFAAPTSQIYLGANLVAANWLNGGRTDYGYSSLWGSTDGSSWQLLLNCQVPTGSSTIGTSAVYAQNLPTSLLGTSQLWLQVRMFEHDALTDAYPTAAEWADAQFSRYDPASPTAAKTFELDVTTVPEPGVVPLALSSLLGCAWLRRKSA